MNLLANIWSNPGMILLLLIIAFACIAGIVFVIRKILFSKNEEKPDEETIVKENLDRYLETVEDEETQKQFDKFNEENKTDEKEDK